MEISGIEVLLFVCLKDSQRTKKADLSVGLVEISGIEVLLFVCLKDSQTTEKEQPFGWSLVEISGIEPLTS